MVFLRTGKIYQNVVWMLFELQTKDFLHGEAVKVQLAKDK